MKYHGELYARLGNKYIPLDKRACQVDELIQALEDIKNWDDGLSEEWGNPRERAAEALQKYQNPAAEEAAQ